MFVRFTVLLCAIAFLAAVASATAQTLATPTGPVVLTITGKIAATNRPPFDAEKDPLFANMKIPFERAAAFDLAMIERLGMHKVRADWPKDGPVYIFEGPLLRDVMAAAGASGTLLKVTAVDGYYREIVRQDVEPHGVILAIKRDGRYLGLGDFGPSWIALPRLDEAPLKGENDEKWVYAILHIDVE